MLFLNQDKNLMALLTILYKERNKWIQLGDLAAVIGVTKKTVRNYVLIVEKKFKDHAEFFYNGSMLYVQFRPNFGLISMKKLLVRESLLYKILFQAFFDPTIKKSDLAFDLGFSETSIYRHVQNFNEQLLGVYDLSFSYSDFQFEGEEKEIRNFYVNMFIETMLHPGEWPFSGTIREDLVETFAERMYSFLHFSPSPAQHNYIKVSIAVSFFRLMQGHTIHTENYRDELIANAKLLATDEVVMKLIDDVMPKKQVSTPVDLLVSILSIFYAEENPILFDDPDLLEEKLQSIKSREAFFKSRLPGFLDQFHLHLEDRDELYRSLAVYFTYRLSNFKKREFFLKRSTYLLAYISFANPELHTELTAIFKEFVREFPEFRDYTIDELTLAFYSLWPDLLSQLFYGREPYKALVVSQDDSFFGKTLVHLINKGTSNLIHAELYDGYRVDMNHLARLPYDLIITDFFVESVPEGTLVYTFGQLPSPYELQGLCRDLRIKKQGYDTDFKKRKGYTDISEFKRLLTVYS